MSSILSTDANMGKSGKKAGGGGTSSGEAGSPSHIEGSSYPRELARTLKEGWAALSADQKAIVGGLAAVDAAGKAVAWVDLARRDKRRVRGPKMLWAPAIAVVNTGGWAAYFLFGRKR